MTKDNKNSFILYTNYYEILNGLEDSEMGAIFRAILRYQATGEMSDLPASLKLAFGFIKNQFDLDEKKYDEFVKKQSENGKKGGRPKNEPEEKENPTFFSEPEENPKNPTLFLKTQKSLNENVNVNENENVSLSSSQREERFLREGRDISFSIEPDEEISDSERDILENYVRRKKLATKNVNAYIRKIIANGDHLKILEEERERERNRPVKISREERIKSELASIHDKNSAYLVLSRYHNDLEEYPPELEEIAEKYNLATSYEIEKYSNDLYLAKMRSMRGT